VSDAGNEYKDSGRIPEARVDYPNIAEAWGKRWHRGNMTAHFDLRHRSDVHRRNKVKGIRPAGSKRVHGPPFAAGTTTPIILCLGAENDESQLAQMVKAS